MRVSGEVKLIIPLSCGASTRCQWKSKSPSLGVSDGLTLSHGDLLVMDVLAQDKGISPDEPWPGESTDSPYVPGKQLAHGCP